MQKVAFIINGSRKLKHSTSSLIEECIQHPLIDGSVFHTTKQKDAIMFARKCVSEKFDVIIAIGGDGTINEVLNGMMQESHENLPMLGIIQNGTGNDFLNSSKMNANQKNFLNSLLQKNATPIDIGKIEAEGLFYYFANISDIGFGGKVIQILNQQRKFIRGQASYSLAILRAFVGFQKPILEITSKNFYYKGAVMMLAFCNGSVFGNGLTINPNAVINDGKMNCTLLGKVTLIDYIKNLGNLKKGKLIQHREAKYFESNAIEVKLIEGTAACEMDGEYLPYSNLKISLLESKVNLLIY